MNLIKKVRIWFVGVLFRFLFHIDIIMFEFLILKGICVMYFKGMVSIMKLKYLWYFFFWERNISLVINY